MMRDNASDKLRMMTQQNIRLLVKGFTFLLQELHFKIFEGMCFYKLAMKAFQVLSKKKVMIFFYFFSLCLLQFHISQVPPVMVADEGVGILVRWFTSFTLHCLSLCRGMTALVEK